MKRLAALLSLIVSTLGGCYAGVAVAYDPYYWDYVYDDPYYYGYDVYFVSTWLDEAVEPNGQAIIDLEATAAALAGEAGTAWTPAGCAVATSTGSRIDYTFTNCEGAFEVESFSGGATLTLSESNGQLLLTATSTNLVVDGKPYVLDLAARHTVNGVQRVAVIDSGSHAPDHVDAREAQGTVNWTHRSGCVDVSGDGSSTLDGRTLTSKVTSYRRCARQCPTGGEVSVDSPDGVFSGRFDGTPQVQAIAPDGNRKTFELRCR